MNIFILDNDPIKAAQAMCDKHVVKMILESAQMLSTAHRILDNRQDKILYKSTHKNHPCTIWVMQSKAHYNWLYRHFKALCKEYTYRYGKTHLTERKLLKHLQTPPKNIEKNEFKGFVAVMDDAYIEADTISAYRNYYRAKQSIIEMKWTKRQMPSWL